jgi:mRNA interferase HigB
MHIISFRKLREFFDKEPDAKVALQDWYRRTKKAEWNNFSEMKLTFNSVDAVGNSRFIFNIRGNNYRLVVKVMFVVKGVYIRWVGKHQDYDKIKDIENL